VTAPMHANKISCAFVLGRFGLSPIRARFAATKDIFKASTGMRSDFPPRPGRDVGAANALRDYDMHSAHPRGLWLV
jgi:hypothetical protein